jgi:hypothetical protein
MEMVALEGRVQDREWGKEGTGMEWDRETDRGMAVEVDRAVGNKGIAEPGYSMESSGCCCNRLALLCYSRSRCVAMTVAPLDFEVGPLDFGRW